MLRPTPGSAMIDGTVGGGGHGLPIAERLAPGGKFLGLDWDGKRIDTLKPVFSKTNLGLKECLLKVGNYANLPEILKQQKWGEVDGLLLDLGFCSDQLHETRGFSFRGPEEPLLMFYSENSQPAYEALSRLTEKQLKEIIRDLSDERFAGRIARAICEQRKNRPILTNQDLAGVIRRAVPRNYEGGRIDPATRTFMALRMYINDEIGNLGRLLGQLKKIVKPGGKVIIISYHSKEDAMVKNFFRGLSGSGDARLLTSKAIRPSPAEIKLNPNSRSAKLRAIQVN